MEKNLTSLRLFYRQKVAQHFNVDFRVVTFYAPHNENNKPQNFAQFSKKTIDFFKEFFSIYFRNV